MVYNLRIVLITSVMGLIFLKLLVVQAYLVTEKVSRLQLRCRIIYPHSSEPHSQISPPPHPCPRQSCLKLISTQGAAW